MRWPLQGRGRREHVQERHAPGVRPAYLTGSYALAIGSERGASVEGHEAIDDGRWGTDALPATGLQPAGDLRRADLFRGPWLFVLIAAPVRDVAPAQVELAIQLGAAGEEVDAMTAGVEPKVTAWALNGAWRDGGTAIRGDGPRAGHLSAAEGTAQAVGAAQPQRFGLAREQVGLLLGRERLNPRSPPVAGWERDSHECPSELMHPVEPSLARVYPDAPGTIGREDQRGQPSYQPEAGAHHGASVPPRGLAVKFGLALGERGLLCRPMGGGILIV
jgi:hypothetical protein